jgi:hypothetical protein
MVITRSSLSHLIMLRTQILVLHHHISQFIIMSATTATSTSSSTHVAISASDSVINSLQSRLERLVTDVDTKLVVSPVLDHAISSASLHDAEGSQSQESVVQVDSNGLPLVPAISFNDEDSGSDGDYGPDIMIIPFQTNTSVDKSYSIPFTFGSIATVKSFVSKIASTVHHFQQDDVRIIQYFLFKQLKYYTLPKDTFHLRHCALVFDSYDYIEDLWEEKKKSKPVTKKAKANLSTWFNDYRDTIHILKSFKKCLENFDCDGVIEDHRSTY